MNFLISILLAVVLATIIWREVSLYKRTKEFILKEKILEIISFVIILFLIIRMFF